MAAPHGPPLRNDVTPSVTSPKSRRIQVQYWKDFSYRGQDSYAGENPPHGAILSYTVANAAPSARITITSNSGDTVRTLKVPASPGVLHRVIWDLRHEPPPSDERTSAFTLNALPRPAHPIGGRGPFVSPGIYTVTLQAGGRRSSQDVRVDGDPKMPLTLAQYRTRERFLVDVLALQKKVWGLAKHADTLSRSLAHAKAAADGAPGASADSAAALARSLHRLVRRVYSLASDFNGSGARSGTLYPPTAHQRRSFETMQTDVSEAAHSLAQLERRSARSGPR